MWFVGTHSSVRANCAEAIRVLCKLNWIVFAIFTQGVSHKLSLNCYCAENDGSRKYISIERWRQNECLQSIEQSSSRSERKQNDNDYWRWNNDPFENHIEFQWSAENLWSYGAAYEWSIQGYSTWSMGLNNATGMNNVHIWCPFLAHAMVWTNPQVLPYINGINHITKIAANSDVEIGLVKACIQNLVYYQVVDVMPLFKYSNVYMCTRNLQQLSTDNALTQACRLVNRQIVHLQFR